MIRKLVIVSLFLGGGFIFIKKILPTLTNRGEDLDYDAMTIEERIAEEERKQRELAKKVQESLKKKFGIYDPKDINRIQSYMFSADINFDDLTPQQISNIKSSIDSTMSNIFPNGLTYDPKNLNSFKGYGNVNLTSMFG